MVQSAKRVYQLTGRAAMYSPDAPSLRNEVERRFWLHIGTGITSEKAAEAVSVSQAVGGRRSLVPLSWRHATIHVETYRWSILVVR